jgi:hypothetical protein
MNIEMTNLVYALRLGQIDWFQYFEGCRLLSDSTLGIPLKAYEKSKSESQKENRKKRLEDC